MSCGKAFANSLVTSCSVTPDGQDGPSARLGRLACVSSKGSWSLFHSFFSGRQLPF